MVYTYSQYLTAEKALPLERMVQLHQEMAEEIGKDADALELYDELMQAAAKYAHTRACWRQMDRQEKAETDALRTSRHDAVIIQMNMLARFLRAQGKEAAWREVLGDEKGAYCRKAIGDFACYLAFMEGVNALTPPPDRSFRAARCCPLPLPVAEFQGQVPGLRR